jgi:hypothetical protein
MARCLRCGNTSRFNMWCSIQKVLEVKVNEQEELIEIYGEPEDESLRVLEDIVLMEEDLAFAMVSCAWCGSKEIAVNRSGERFSPRILQ